jgi:hypothetical protein
MRTALLAAREHPSNVARSLSVETHKVVEGDDRFKG